MDVSPLPPVVANEVTHYNTKQPEAVLLFPPSGRAKESARSIWSPQEMTTEQRTKKGLKKATAGVFVPVPVPRINCPEWERPPWGIRLYMSHITSVAAGSPATFTCSVAELSFRIHSGARFYQVIVHKWDRNATTRQIAIEMQCRRKSVEVYPNLLFRRLKVRGRRRRCVRSHSYPIERCPLRGPLPTRARSPRHSANYMQLMLLSPSHSTSSQYRGEEEEEETAGTRFFMRKGHYSGHFHFLSSPGNGKNNLQVDTEGF